MVGWQIIQTVELATSLTSFRTLQWCGEQNRFLCATSMGVYVMDLVASPYSLTPAITLKSAFVNRDHFFKQPNPWLQAICTPVHLDELLSDCSNGWQVLRDCYPWMGSAIYEDGCCSAFRVIQAAWCCPCSFPGGTYAFAMLNHAHHLQVIGITADGPEWRLFADLSETLFQWAEGISWRESHDSSSEELPSLKQKCYFMSISTFCCSGHSPLLVTGHKSGHVILWTLTSSAHQHHFRIHKVIQPEQPASDVCSISIFGPTQSGLLLLLVGLLDGRLECLTLREEGHLQHRQLLLQDRDQCSVDSTTLVAPNELNTSGKLSVIVTKGYMAFLLQLTVDEEGLVLPLKSSLSEDNMLIAKDNFVDVISTDTLNAGSSFLASLRSGPIRVMKVDSERCQLSWTPLDLGDGELFRLHGVHGLMRSPNTAFLVLAVNGFNSFMSKPKGRLLLLAKPPDPSIKGVQDRVLELLQKPDLMSHQWDWLEMLRRDLMRKYLPASDLQQSADFCSQLFSHLSQRGQTPYPARNRLWLLRVLLTWLEKNELSGDLMKEVSAAVEKTSIQILLEHAVASLKQYATCLSGRNESEKRELSALAHFARTYLSEGDSEMSSTLGSLPMFDWRCPCCEQTEQPDSADPLSCVCADGHTWTRCSWTLQPCDGYRVRQCLGCRALFRPDRTLFNRQDCLFCLGSLTF